jgi:vitamin B12 transporter
MNNKIKSSILTSTLLVSTLGANIDLGTVTVYSATKSEQSIKDITSNIDVITSMDIEEKNYTTVTQALNSIAGINITSNGGLGQGSFVRMNGMHYSSTLVLIDGVRYNDITNGSAFLENILVSDIKQIEIIKGAQSGIWGADASGGVINIITKDAKEGMNGSINTEYGSFNTKKYGGSISYKEDKYYFKLNTQKFTSDGFSAQVPNGDNIDDYEDDGYENTTISIKTGVKLNDTNKIDLSHTVIDSEVEYDKNIYVGWNKDNIASANSNVISTSKSKFTKVNFNHIDSFNEVDIYVNKSSFDRNADGTIYIGEVKEIGLKSNISYNEKDFLIWGLDKKEFIENDTMNKKYTNDAIFLTNSNILENTILTQSLRYDKYSNFENKTTGKLGIKHNISKDFSMTSNYGTGYKVPTMNNLYAVTYGNTNLKPESTKSFDLSTKYKDIEIKYFKNKIVDRIDYDSVSPYQFKNHEGTSIIKGFEINYKKDIYEDILLSMNYTKLDAKDKDNKTLGRVAEELLKISVDYYGIDKLHVNVNGEYVGDRYDFNGGKDALGQSETGNYTVINSVLNYDIKKDLKIYLKCDNLTNKYYQTVNGYATSPRAYYVGLNAKF